MATKSQNPTAPQKAKHLLKSVKNKGEVVEQNQALSTARQEIQDRTDLDPTLKKVFLAHLDPWLASMTTKGLADELGLPYRAVYSIRTDPRFFAEMSKLARPLITQFLPQIIAASIETALLPGREGYPDRKMLYEMAGFSISPKGKADQEKASHGKKVDRIERARTMAAKARPVDPETGERIEPVKRFDVTDG